MDKKNSENLTWTKRTQKIVRPRNGVTARCNGRDPPYGQKGFYSGKKHALKTQVIIELTTRKIMCLRHGKGKIHDFKLFKKSQVKLSKDKKC